MIFIYLFKNLLISQSLFNSIFQRISQTAEPLGFSFTVKLLIGAGKACNYFGETTETLRREITPRKN